MICMFKQSTSKQLHSKPSPHSIALVYKKARKVYIMLVKITQMKIPLSSQACGSPFRVMNVCDDKKTRFQTRLTTKSQYMSSD